MKITVFLVVLFLTTVFCQDSDNFWEDDSEMRDYQDNVFQKVKCGTVPYGTSELYSQNFRSVQYEASSVHTQSLLDKIVGGSEAVHGEIPWQASVKAVELTDGHYQISHVCGAVILSEYWLLSAAHCFDNTSVEAWRVTVGEHHLHRADPGQQEFEVDVFNHARYHPITYDYDIALLKIKPANGRGGIQFNDFVQPICLPETTSYLKDGTSLLVSGWGGILPCDDCDNETQEYPDVLLKAVVPFISQQKCESNYPGRLTDNMFCAGYDGGRIDACAADSGGPIASKSGDRYVVHGVVSWGDGCAQPNQPGVYTRVAAFLPWIESTINSNSRKYR